MALSEATSVVPPNPETPSTNHAHSNQGSLPSSPDPDPTPSDLDHAVLDELQKLDLKEPVEEGDGEPDELQKLDSTEKVEEDGVGELQKLDLKEEEDGAGELQTLDLKEEEGGDGKEEEEKSSGEREVEILNGEENERQSEQSYQSDGGGGEGWGGNQGWEEDGGEVEEKKAEETQESNRMYQYPVKPEAEDCSYYLKTGSCKFRSNCKFNHPVSRKTNQRFGGVILGFWGKDAQANVWNKEVPIAASVNRWSVLDSDTALGSSASSPRVEDSRKQPLGPSNSGLESKASGSSSSSTLAGQPVGVIADTPEVDDWEKAYE